jgi:hypothetical protein
VHVCVCVRVHAANGGVDELLKGFRSWLLLQSVRYVRQARRETIAWKRSGGDDEGHPPRRCGWLQGCFSSSVPHSHTAQLAEVGRKASGVDLALHADMAHLLTPTTTQLV